MRSRTHVDYVTGTSSAELGAVEQAIQAVFSGGVAAPVFKPGAGMHHFDKRADIEVAGIHAGTVMWGGAAQKGRSRVELAGKGCELVPDWERAESVLCGLEGFRYTRLDIAADFFHGELRHEDVQRAHRLGKFVRARAKNPELQEVRSSDPARGRTLYVGRRGGDHMVRFYEKGKKEFFGAGLRALRRMVEEASQVRAQDDARNHGAEFNLADWYRAEVELRAVNRPIPLDCIERRDEYFAGCYPFMAELLPHVKPQLLVRPRAMGVYAVERALELVQEQWGRALYTALHVHFGDIGAVWEKIVGEAHSPTLVRAGALLAIDEAGPSVPSSGAAKLH